jgi:uncharacterized protein YcbK (DUF882 family)
MKRRQVIQATGAVLMAAAVPGQAIFEKPEPRQLRFYHTHTGEKLDVVYFRDDAYQPDALESINHLLRDFRSREVRPIDVELLDILYTIRARTLSDGDFQVISAYRSPATNEMLRNKTDGVAKHSLHMRGQAIDVRLTDVSTKKLRQAALDLRLGGVGYYPKSDFVHLDTGNVRAW